MEIQNKTITLNEGEIGSNQSGSCGILIKDNDTENQGYIMTDTTSRHFLIKPPQGNTVFTLRCQPTDFYDIATKLYTDT